MLLAYMQTRISIHAPTRGATIMRPPQILSKTISIHAPTRGATNEPFMNAVGATISIHAPTRGATCEECGAYLDPGISIHAPTRGATSFASAIPTVRYPFQSTLPQGERRHSIFRSDSLNDFNPRSHKGSDAGLLYFCLTSKISIHAPTRGATW